MVTDARRAARQLSQSSSQSMDDILGTDTFACLGYDAIYSAESHLNTHGGLGSILGHVTEDEASRQILDARPEDDALARHRLLMGVSLLVSADQIPARRAVLPHERLDRLAQRIMDLNPTRTV